MTANMDATTSFQYIVDHLPSWREQVISLTTYTSQKTEEFKAEYTRLVSKTKPRRIKSPSICSIHTEDNVEQKDADISQEQTPSLPDPVEISPFEAGNRYIYAQATKKRKPGTSFRSGASGPMKFRSKHMAIIYYDSYAQDQLDSLVKAIGGSRNNLRKGKMAYTVAKGLQLPTLGRKHDLPSPFSGPDGIRSSAYRNGLKLSAGKSEANITSDSLPSGEAAFKEADKELETCQNLCETAAHQFLRDGDCQLELDTVVRNFDKVLDLAKTTLELLKAEEKDESPAESGSVSGSTTAESDRTLVEKPSQEGFDPLSKLMPTPHAMFTANRPSLPNTNSAPPVMTEIEVDDDSDQSSIEIDVSKFRMASRANRGRIRA